MATHGNKQTIGDSAWVEIYAPAPWGNDPAVCTMYIRCRSGSSGRVLVRMGDDGETQAAPLESGECLPFGVARLGVPRMPRVRVRAESGSAEIDWFPMA